MIDRDLVETLVALALIIACAVSAIASASPPKRERVERDRQPSRRAQRRPVTHNTAVPPPPSVAESTAQPAVPAGHRARPRILTGEPAEPEPHRPAARRAVKLVGGVTALAAGGAVGLLVLVRALVAMFN